MQKLLLHIILFSYAIVMFKPAFPYLNDVIAHALFLQQHMATVHFENGKYHVHAEVTKNIKNENSSKDSLPEKKKNITIEYTVLSSREIIVENKSLAADYGKYRQLYIYPPCLPFNYPPPRI